jgi:hypothetical protein
MVIQMGLLTPCKWGCYEVNYSLRKPSNQL